MDLSKIISISGMPGLFKVIGSMRNGAVVESLTDGKRFPTFASHKISSLTDISVYTSGENVALTEIFKKIYEKEDGKETPQFKPDSDEIKKYFETVLPEYDKEKVHNSDIKKIISWYNILLKKDLLKPEETKTEEAKPEEKSEEHVVTFSEKPAVKKTELHQTAIHVPKPVTAAPRKNINVRRKTG